MNALLHNLTKTVRTRMQDYRDLTTGLSRIIGSKVATLMDMESAFYDSKRETPDSILPRGIAGKKFHKNYPSFARAFHIAASFYDMPVFLLPASLLNTQSREEFERRYGHLRLTEEQRAQREQELRDFATHIFSLRPEDPLHVIIPDGVPSHVPCVYLGDFVDLADGEINFQRTLKLAAAFGDAQEMKLVINALRDVPDYSQHFPDRPPHNGKGRKQDDARPAIVPGVLVPGRA